MRTVLMLIGLPASGKTTHSLDLMKAEPGRWIHVSRDDLRFMVTGCRRPGAEARAHEARREELLRAMKLELTRLAIAQGFDVILDDTHLIASTRGFVRAFVEQLGDVELVEKTFRPPVEECLRRNARRDGIERVPRRIIVSMAAHAEWPAASSAPTGAKASAGA